MVFFIFRTIEPDIYMKNGLFLTSTIKNRFQGASLPRGEIIINTLTNKKRHRQRAER
jgi:hypothetical protein